MYITHPRCGGGLKVDKSGNGVRDSKNNAYIYNNFAVMRHSRGLNVSFSDGSASWKTFHEWEVNMNNSGWIFNEKYNTD